MVVWRDDAWRIVHLFDNAHDVGDEKQAPEVTYGYVNEAMAIAYRRLLDDWPRIVEEWEHTR